jgi:SPOR domain
MKKSGLSLVFSLFVLLGINGQAAAQSTRYTVQLEATQVLEIAQQKVKGFKGQGLDAYIVKIDVQGKGTFYRIRVGNFPTQADARKYGTDLQRLGFSSDFFIAPYEPPQGDLTEIAPTRGVANPSASTPPATAPSGKTQPVKDQPKEDVKQPAPPANTPPAAPPTAPPANTQSAKEPVKQTAAAANIAPVTAPPANTPPATTGNEQKLAANINATTTNPITPTASTPPPPAANALAASSAAVTPAGINFTKFQDLAIGYSFERPLAWEGGQLDTKDAKDQNVSSGALFKSAQDSAFITAIWNNLEKANSPEQDNNLIVELILQSMGSDSGTQNLTELRRKVVSENGIIKTYLDLQMTFKPQQGQDGPLDFLGKALIARTNKGILLVATLYWKGGPPYVADVAEKIIASVRPPL